MTTGEDETENASDQRPDDAETTTGPAKAPRTRKPLSGLELEARFDGWAMQRRAKKEEPSSEQIARSRRRSVGALLGVGILAIVITTGVTGEQFTGARVDNEAEIKRLTTQLEVAAVVPEDTDLAEQMTRLSEAAAADAKKVATAQQGFASLFHRESTETAPRNGAPSKVSLDIADHRRALAPLFDKRSYLVKDSEAYSWSTAVTYDVVEEIDPRYEWYVRHDGDTASKSSASAWRVETVLPDLGAADATGSTDRAQVVWLCEDTASGDVLAWASADYVYDGENGAFRDLDLVVTSAGADHQYSKPEKGKKHEVPDLRNLGDKDTKGGRDR